jgi:predicted ATP-binding protein involved in virulence
MNPSEQIPPPAYFSSLTIENVKCFKGKHDIDLSDGNDKPAMWTVILGNNNTGKTTLLRCLAYLAPVKKNEKNERLYAPKLSQIDLANNVHFGSLECNWISDICIENWECSASYGTIEVNDIKLDAHNIHTHTLLPYEYIGKTVIYGYGTSRRMGKTSLDDNENQDNTVTLFEDNLTLINAEDFILKTDYASKNNVLSAIFRLEKIKQILTNGLLPDVKDFRCTSIEINNQIKNFVEFKTDYGWVKLRELGYGYQVTLAWIVDLAKKLFERYPRSKNPLHEPAIVLIDEIDLHLHPEWQRKIIQFLSEQFPRTQFIATSHSPLIVQSADNINLVLLEKEGDHVVIKQRPDIKTFKGWTVEEILTELMGLGERTLSDDYLKFMHKFDEALDEDDYAKAKNAYDELDKILHPYSSQRKLLRIQMSGLIPA